MKFFWGGAELLAFLRFMQGACYLLTTNNFRLDFDIIGAAFPGEFHLQGSPESFTAGLPPGVHLQDECEWEFHLLAYLLGVSWVTEITCLRFIEITGLGWVHRNCMFEAWG